MATDTMESKGIASPRWNTKGVKLREFRANGSDIKACMLVTTKSEATDKDIDLATTGEVATGIVWTRYDTDKDTAYADNDENVPVALFKENQGLGIWAYTSESVAVDIEVKYAAVVGTTYATTDADIAVLQGAEQEAADNTYVKLRKYLII